jgi:hypothetical protein
MASTPTRRGLVLAGMISIVAVVVGWQLLRPPVVPPGGGVLGVTQNGTAATAGPPADASPSATASPTPLASRTSDPGAASPSASADIATADPAFRVGEAAAVTWRGTFGETRLQVIVPIRNVGSGWFRLPRSTSTYRVLDDQGREIASGMFTAALPVTIGPSQVGYLVDTVSAAFLAPSGTPSVTTKVEAVAVDRPGTELAVADLAASTGASGGMRVTGVVRNDGSRPAEWVIAGAVLLARDGRPLAAVYDPSDGGRLEPGAAMAFDTEYPGSPPPPPGGAGTTLIGFAFEALDNPTQ